jgi:hypothetical protein
MTSWLSIVEKMGTFFDETIYIMSQDVVHLQGYQNKIVPLMKPFYICTKFHNYHSINDFILSKVVASGSGGFTFSTTLVTI